MDKKHNPQRAFLLLLLVQLHTHDALPHNQEFIRLHTCHLCIYFTRSINYIKSSESQVIY